MTEPDSRDARSTKTALLIGLARHAIERGLGRSGEPPGVPNGWGDWLEAPAATFVTLELDGRLRGCIGSLGAQRSLREDVGCNAHAAAFEDPRFPALTAGETSRLRVEVSVLSETEPLDCSTEADLLATLRPGIDGLVLECGAHRSTFLPQVWKNLPASSDFVAALKKKAGLERRFWSDQMRFFRYTVEKYRQEDVDEAADRRGRAQPCS